MTPPLLPRPLRTVVEGLPIPYLTPGADGGSLDDLAEAVGGRRVVVTGASSGIGEAVVLAIARAGAHVITIARTAETLDEQAQRLTSAGASATAYPADLSDKGDTERVAEEILRDHGVVDVLVNNAGHSIRRLVEDSYDRDDFERTMALNYFGALRLTLAFLPGMRRARSGHIVNVSTMGVHANTPRFSAYLASKAALDAFARSMAPEVVVDGVDVTTVYMPLVRTPMIAPTRLYDRMPALTTEQGAGLVCRALVDRPREVTPLPGRVLRLAYPFAAKTSDRIAGGVTRRL